MRPRDRSQRTVRRRRVALRLATLVGLGLLACVSRWPTGDLEQQRYYRTATAESPGQPVGEEACLDCHASFDGHHVQSDQHGYCEACHGPGERHAFTTLAQDIRFPGAQDCIACHGTGHVTVAGWDDSEHARAGLLCSSCHHTHGRELHLLRHPKPMGSAVLPRASLSSRMCTGCHPEVTSQLNLPSHHPLGEGMLDCTSCHAPHQSDGDRLGARTDSCAACHQEQTGPWIYEHAPVSEDCSFCHVPHGSTQDYLLEASQPALCISCHTIATSGAVHDPFAYTTRCTDCHGAVHGSYADPHLRR